MKRLCLVLATISFCCVFAKDVSLNETQMSELEINSTQEILKPNDEFKRYEYQHEVDFFGENITLLYNSKIKISPGATLNIHDINKNETKKYELQGMINIITGRAVEDNISIFKGYSRRYNDSIYFSGVLFYKGIIVSLNSFNEENPAENNEYPQLYIESATDDTYSEYLINYRDIETDTRLYRNGRHSLYEDELNQNILKRCEVDINIGYSYYASMRKDKENVIASIIYYVQTANDIMASINFDTEERLMKISLLIKNITIFEDEESDTLNGTSFNLLRSQCSYLPRHKHTCLALCFVSNEYLNRNYDSKVDIEENYLAQNLMDIGALRVNTVVLETSQYTRQHTIIHRSHLIALKMITFFKLMFHDDEDSPEGFSVVEKDLTRIAFLNGTDIKENYNFHFINKFSNSSRWLLLEDEHCGDGHLNEAEMCDCGTFNECLHDDRCCTLKMESILTSGCQVNIEKDYRCSKQTNPCCTEQCRFKNDKELCNVQSKTCLKGRCISDICRDNGYDLCPCRPTVSYCLTCCFDSKDECVSSDHLNISDLKYDLLMKQERSICHTTVYDYETQSVGIFKQVNIIFTIIIMAVWMLLSITFCFYCFRN